MQKQFLSNLIITILLNLLVKPVALFAIDASVQNRVGEAEYGLYFTLLNLTVIFNIFLDFGINNYTTKRIAQQTTNQANFFGSIMVFRLILFIVYALVVSLTAIMLGYGWREFHILLFLVINQLLILSIAFFRSHFSGLHLFKTDAIISIMDRFLLILIAGYLLFISNSDLITIDSFVYIQTICYFITFIVGWTVLNKQIKGPFFYWDFKGSLAIIKQSLPYAALILLMLLYNRSDAVILERIHINGRIEAGFYAQGFRLLDALYMFGMIFAGLLFPMFSRLLKNAINEVTPLLQTAGNLLVGGSIVIVTISLFNAQFFLDLLYHNVNSSSILSFQLLISCFIPICINFIFGTLLTANGNLKILNIISFSAVIFSIGLNLFIIPGNGAVGAALVALCTQSLVALIQMHFGLKCIQLKLSFKDFLPYLILIGSMNLFGYSLQLLQLNPLLDVCIFALFGLFLLFVLSLIDIKNIKKIIFSKA